jgi:hypothetical protein
MQQKIKKIIVDFKPIPESPQKHGMQLLKRVDDYALYVTNCFSFEVHLIRIRKNVFVPFSNTLYKKVEAIASSEEFGKYGWSYERLSTVFRYFGFYGEYVDEILEKLDHCGYELFTKTKYGVKNGYLF